MPCVSHLFEQNCCASYCGNLSWLWLLIGCAPVCCAQQKHITVAILRVLVLVGKTGVKLTTAFCAFPPTFEEFIASWGRPYLEEGLPKQ